jgi:hypothetical protein
MRNTCLTPWYKLSQNTSTSEKNVDWNSASNTCGIQLSTITQSGNRGSFENILKLINGQISYVI